LLDGSDLGVKRFFKTFDTKVGLGMFERLYHFLSLLFWRKVKQKTFQTGLDVVGLKTQPTL